MLRRNCLAAVVEQIPAAVAVIGRRRNLVLRNSRYNEMFKTASSPDLTHTGFEVCDTRGATVPVDRWPSSRALDNSELVKNEEFQVIFRDGSKTWMSVSAAPIQDGEDKMDGAVIVFTDISERKAAEEQRTRAMQGIIEIQENERLRIARELHDDLGQQLTAIDLKLKRLLDRVPEGPFSDDLVDFGRIVDGMMERVRDITKSLRPLALEDFGLKAALIDLSTSWSDRLAIPIDLHVDETLPRLPDETLIVVYRMIQEALTNIARHSEASNVSITVQAGRDSLRVVIEDDGRGFDPDHANINEGHFGLAGMRERLSMLRGSLQIESSPGSGTRIVGTIPLDGGA